MSGTPLRLRLTVQRNGLPEARIAFVFAASEDATICSLLDQVNDTIPLEDADWGLDDYVVELRATGGTGFECLHFQPVTHLLEKDDEVLIRPLSSDELKKRRISGRHQIANDGKHLVDGVPFGRPRLKRPCHRPPVHISPRKRRRLTYPDEPNDTATHGTSPDGWADGSTVDAGIDDELFDNDSSYIDESSDSFELASDIDFEELQLLQAEACEQAKPALLEYTRLSGSTGSGGSRNTTVSKRSSSIWATSVRGSGVARYHTSLDPGPDLPSDVDYAQDHAKNSTSSLSSYYSVDSDINPSGSVVNGSLDAAQQKDDSQIRAGDAASSPGAAGSIPKLEGKPRTKKRNARRRAKRAMERSKQANPALAENILNNTEAISTNIPHFETPAADSSLGGVPNSLPSTADSHTERRLKLDIGAGRRILFGALGIKDPRSTPKRDEGQALPIEHTGPEPKIDHNSRTPSRPDMGTCAAGGDGQKQESEDKIPESWREHISYRAVECAGRRTNLCEPPFPFSQQWNDQRDKQKTAVPIPVSSGGRGSSSESPGSTGQTALHAGSKGPSHNSVQLDLPALPPDISSLPELRPGDAVAGMVITWKTWLLSSKTNWQPEIIDLTAVIDEVRDGGAQLHLTLAQRDQGYDNSDKLYDEETGERLYGRFEVPDVDDPEQDDGPCRVIAFSELMEPRIVST